MTENLLVFLGTTEKTCYAPILNFYFSNGELYITWIGDDGKEKTAPAKERMITDANKNYINVLEIPAYIA